MLDLETDAARQNIREQERLREIDLNASLQVMRSEAKAKLDQLDIEFKAEVAKQQAVITAETDPEKRMAEQRALDQATAMYKVQTGEIVDELTVRQKAIVDQIGIAQTQMHEELATTDQTYALKREQIEEALGQKLVQLQSQNVQQREQALQELAQTQVQLTQYIASEEVRLRAQGVPESEITQRLAPFKAIQGQITGIFGQQQADVQQTVADLGKALDSVLGETPDKLTTLSNMWGDFVDKLTKMIDPLIEKIKLLGPQFLQQVAPPGTVPAAGAPVVPPAWNTPVALPPGAAPEVQPSGYGPQGMTININGAKVEIPQGKEQVFAEVLSMLLGPEGAKAIDDWRKGQPGWQHPATA
jgi:hypothetical protein